MHWHQKRITERVASFLKSLSEINVKKKESLTSKEIPSIMCAVGTDGDMVSTDFLG